MIKQIKASLNVLIATFLLMFATNFLPLAAAMAAGNDKKDATGNNGTLKVHEKGTPEHDINNDPKVCVFNLEGFNFDSNDSGYFKFEVQGGDGPTGIAPTGEFALGPTDNDGYAASEYFNDGASTTTVPNGHYKVTLYGKDNGGNIDLSDTKAKSKVFKVTCDDSTDPEDPQDPTPVTAEPVIYVDKCRTKKDTFTVPAVENVTYVDANDQVVPAGTYPGAGTVELTAVEADGYVLTEPYSFAYTFTNVRCGVPKPKVTLCHATGSESNPYEEITVSRAAAFNGHYGQSHQNGEDVIPPFTYKGQSYSQNYDAAGTALLANHCVVTVTEEPTEVMPLAPSFTPPTCKVATGSYTIPEVEGVIYKVNGNVVDAGVHQAVKGTSVTITAEAADGYVLKDGATGPWSYEFSLKTGCVLGDNDVCPNIDGSQLVVPTGYKLDKDGNCVKKSGHVLGDTTELANTGANTLVSVIAGATIIVIAAGTRFVGRRVTNL